MEVGVCEEEECDFGGGGGGRGEAGVGGEGGAAEEGNVVELVGEGDDDVSLREEFWNKMEKQWEREEEREREYERRVRHRRMNFLSVKTEQIWNLHKRISV